MKFVAFVLSLLLTASSVAMTLPHYYRPLNGVFAGHGKDSFTGETGPSLHFPMAYGLFLSAFVADGMIEDAERAANWLIENKDRNGDGVTGWGLPFAYDAFSDDTTNPEHTEYGITTAEVVRGLLDLYEATQEPRYLETAIEGLEGYATAYFGWGFSYSKSGTDAVRVHNVNAMLMGQYARAATLTGRSDLQRIADNVYTGLMDEAHDDGAQMWWDYSIETGRKNDLVHAAYIAIGLKEYGAPEPVLQKALAHMHGFLRNGTVYEYTHTDDYLARAWGMGAGLYTACLYGDEVLKNALLAALPAYRTARDEYTIRPGEGFYAPRMQAHVAWGLSRC